MIAPANALEILAIAAHRDDVEQTCGGALLRMAEMGYRTGVLDLTAGDMGTRGTPEIRLKESDAAGCKMQLAWRGNLRLPDAKPWLFAIVRNCCFTRLKKLRPFVELNESAPIPSSDPDPEAIQFQRVDAETLEAGLRKLPEEFREALVLREMEDLSYKEIADVTGVAIGTVMSRLSRARRQLQQHLAVPEKQESPR